MNTFFTIDFWVTFMLPTAVSLAIFYLFYKAIVRNDTHLNIRRFTILGFLVFAIALPFLNISIPTNTVVATGLGAFQLPTQNFVHELPVFTVFAEGNVVNYTGIVETHGRASLPMVLQIIGWIYLAIVLILIGRIFVGVWRLSRLSKNGRASLQMKKLSFRKISQPHFHFSKQFLFLKRGPTATKKRWCSHTSVCT